MPSARSTRSLGLAHGHGHGVSFGSHPPASSSLGRSLGGVLGVSALSSGGGGSQLRAFAENVRQLVDACGTNDDAVAYSCTGTYPTKGCTAWRIPLANGDSLLIVEEINAVQANRVECGHCRCVGWGHQPANGTTTFHFIILHPNCTSVAQTRGGRRTCPHCLKSVAVAAGPGPVTCQHCKSEFATFLEDTTHILHGMVHANGCGHLLRINGREGVAEAAAAVGTYAEPSQLRGAPQTAVPRKQHGDLSGTQVMDSWDRLCAQLRVSRISVEDASTKHGLDYRLLHAIVHGSTWYGKWAYTVGRGGYGIPATDWQWAVRHLQTCALKDFMQAADAVPSFEATRRGATLAACLRWRGEGNDHRPHHSHHHPHRRHNLRIDGDDGAAWPGALTSAKKLGTPLRRWVAAHVPSVKTLGELMAELLSAYTRAAASEARADAAECLRIVMAVLLEYPVLACPPSRVMEIFSLAFAPAGNGSSTRFGHIVQQKRRQQHAHSSAEEPLPLSPKLASAIDPASPVPPMGVLAIAGMEACRHRIETDRGARQALRKAAASTPAELAQMGSPQKPRAPKVSFVSRVPGWSGRGRPPNHVVAAALELEARERAAEAAAADTGAPPVTHPLFGVACDPLAALPTAAAAPFAHHSPQLESALNDGMGDLGVAASLVRALRESARIILDVKFFVKNAGTAATTSQPPPAKRARRSTAAAAAAAAAASSDPWQVTCSCGVRDDDGERMIACDECGQWHHTRCSGISNAVEVLPAVYFCKECIGK